MYIFSCASSRSIATARGSTCCFCDLTNADQMDALDSPRARRAPSAAAHASPSASTKEIAAQFYRIQPYLIAPLTLLLHALKCALEHLDVLPLVFQRLRLIEKSFSRQDQTSYGSRVEYGTCDCSSMRCRSLCAFSSSSVNSLTLYKR